MNLILILSLLSGIAFCASFKWDFVRSIREGYSTFRCGSTVDGSIHMFWHIGHRVNFKHRVLLPNGTLTQGIHTEYKNIREAEPFKPIISEDGKQILNPLDQIYSASYTRPIFMESTNGGLTWTEPKPLNESLGNRSFTDGLDGYIDKDTGRVYVVTARYIHGNGGEPNPATYLILSIKEPGETKFEKEITLLTLPEDRTIICVRFGLTTDKKSSKRYLHVFIRSNEGIIYYTRSADDGITWSNFKEISQDLSREPSINVGNNNAIEGGIYIQVWNKDGLEIVRSNDHGTTWESPVEVREEKHGFAKNDVAVCGNGKKGILVSTSMSFDRRTNIIFATVDSKVGKFYELPYPLRDGLEKRMIHCQYVKEGLYSITYIGQDYNRDVYYARGSLEGI